MFLVSASNKKFNLEIAKDKHQLEFVDRDKVLDLLPLLYHKRAIKHYLEK